jgi:ketosteroid isomerase-like protein
VPGRAEAEAVLARLHAAQGELYSGGDPDAVRAVLTDDIHWVVPGENAIAGDYRGIDAVVAYMLRRRDLAGATFRMHPGEVLVGDGDSVAVRTDGTATIAGTEHRWSTLGLYELRDGRIASCRLLALDQAAFDAAWADHGVAGRSGPP